MNRNIGWTRTRTARRRTLVLVSIIVLLAMILSFTLAWFAQMLASRDNTLASAGSDGAYVELWAQTARNGLHGTNFSDIDNDAIFHTDAAETATTPAVITNNYLPLDTSTGPSITDGAHVPENTLYKIVKAVGGSQDGQIYKDPSNPSTSDYNRLLNDGGFLPYQTVTRRLIIRNTSDIKVNYTVNFAKTKDAAGLELANSLAEAFEVQTVKVERVESNSNPDGYTISRTSVTDTSGVDINTLTSRSITGGIESKSFDIYELTFTFLGSASNYYEGTNFQLDVTVDARGGAQTHFVSTEEELKKLLGIGNPALMHGDSIALKEDIEFHGDFITDKLFNLDLNNKQLKITGNFGIEPPKNQKGEDIFGTIDIAYKTPAQSKLNIQGWISIDAPKAAVRWNKDAAISPAIPKNDAERNIYQLNVRVFNGEESLSDHVLHSCTVTINGSLKDDYNYPINEAYDGGTGTQDDPYLIGSGSAYRTLMETTNSGNDHTGEYFKLVRDIDFENGVDIDPIGGKGSSLNDNTRINPFSGIFDGNNRKISNLTISRKEMFVGIFGYVVNGTIHNLANVNGKMENTYQVNSGANAAGIAGGITATTIERCYNTGTAKGSVNVGGIVGWAMQSNINECYNTGTIECNSTYTGGINGWNAASNIKGCYNTGYISTSSGGGIAGCFNDAGGTLKGCYNIANMDSGNSGGLIGQNLGSAVSHNTYLAGTASCYTAAGPDGGEGDTSASVMKTAATVNGLNAGTGEDTYVLSSSKGFHYPYPVLAWQEESAEWTEYAFLNNEGSSNANNPANTTDYTKILPAAAYPAGNGTKESPYQIDSIGTWRKFELSSQEGTGDLLGGQYFQLVCNLDFKGMTNLHPVSQNSLTDLNITRNFSGVFDGMGHEIRNAALQSNPNATVEYHVALFQNIKDATICNLSISGGSSTGVFTVGGLVANAAGNSHIYNCHNSSSVTAAQANAAGIAASLSGNVVIENCTNSGAIQGVDYSGGIVGKGTEVLNAKNCLNIGMITSTGMYTGGIVGLLTDGTITDCINEGTISVEERYVGGIVGFMSGGIVQQCGNNGDIPKSTRFVGGIAGRISGDSKVQYCYNHGNLTAKLATAAGIGGVVGFGEGSVLIMGCYNTGNVSNTSTTAGSSGGVIGGATSGTTVKGCYTTGNVTNPFSTYHGMACGWNDSSTTQNIYALPGASPNAVGSSSTAVNITDVAIITADSLKSDTYLERLNDTTQGASGAFVAFIDAPPRLAWEARKDGYYRSGFAYTFAGKQWWVADVDTWSDCAHTTGDVTLLWADTPLTAKAFDGKSNDWGSSSLRKWLNSESRDGFLGSLTMTATERIQLVSSKNPGQKYKEGGVYHWWDSSEDVAWLFSTSQLFGSTNAKDCGNSISSGIVGWTGWIDGMGGRQFQIFQGRSAQEIANLMNPYYQNSYIWTRSPNPNFIDLSGGMHNVNILESGKLLVTQECGVAPCIKVHI